VQAEISNAYTLMALFSDAHRNTKAKTGLTTEQLPYTFGIVSGQPANENFRRDDSGF
jgi:hypothetical protein